MSLNTADCLWDGGDCCKTGQLFNCLDPSHSAKGTGSAKGFLTTSTYPINPRYIASGPVTPRTMSTELFANTYNNFYEYGLSKDISAVALQHSDLHYGPWPIEISGLVANPMILDAADLISMFVLEERVYRHRCVEAWSMVVPWLGFPLGQLLDMVKPRADAKFIRFQSFDSPVEGGYYFPFPYHEGLRVDEAYNELAFIAVGQFGKRLTPQAGAPIRLVVPWKYGYKSIKSLVKIEFVSAQPNTFWSEVNPSEYGFYSDINPKYPHPRWSQASERAMGGSASASVIPTDIYNGYETLVSYMYKNFSGTNHWF